MGFEEWHPTKRLVLLEMMPSVQNVAADNGAEHSADHDQQAGNARLLLGTGMVGEHHLAEKGGDGVEDAHVNA
jgi:hypothetical protein